MSHLLSDKNTLLTGVSSVLPMQEFEEKLALGRPLKVKAGFDPTAPDIHMGHTVVLNKLRQFQIMGHEAIILIGDFTAMIGDPTGKNAARQPLTKEAILHNTQTYTEQVFKILDPALTRIVYNSAWFDAFNAADLIRLASSCSVARMLERDDFSKRYTANQPIAIHEFLYPLLQGHDSVVLEADLELGGTDQEFNLLMGRTLQKQNGQVPQVVMMMPLLEGLDGVKKMSKSLDNYIGVAEAPDMMFGKIMSLSDPLMWRYIHLLSARALTEIKALEAAVEKGMNPRDVKIEFAKEIVTRFHNALAAEQAYEAFIQRFQKNQIPDDLETQVIQVGTGTSIAQLLKLTGLTASTSEAIRMVQQGSVKINSEKVIEHRDVLAYDAEYIVQVGKRKIIKLKLDKSE